jgi:hypothetical protein
MGESGSGWHWCCCPILTVWTFVFFFSHFYHNTRLVIVMGPSSPLVCACVSCAVVRVFVCAFSVFNGLLVVSYILVIPLGDRPSTVNFSRTLVQNLRIFVHFQSYFLILCATTGDTRDYFNFILNITSRLTSCDLLRGNKENTGHRPICLEKQQLAKRTN